MNHFERLLQKCELLKMRIRELKVCSVEETQKSIQAIQIEMLQSQLSEVGRQLKNMTLYKRDEDD